MTQARHILNQGLFAGLVGVILNQAIALIVGTGL